MQLRRYYYVPCAITSLVEKSLLSPHDLICSRSAVAIFMCKLSVALCAVSSDSCVINIAVLEMCHIDFSGLWNEMHGNADLRMYLCCPCRKWWRTAWQTCFTCSTSGPPGMHQQQVFTQPFQLGQSRKKTGKAPMSGRVSHVFADLCLWEHLSLLRFKLRLSWNCEDCRLLC